jgi:hypothetical protein
MTRTHSVTCPPLRRSLALLIGISVAGMPAMISGCKKEESSTKTQTTKTTETPEGVKKTTETTEKKVEKEQK